MHMASGAGNKKKPISNQLNWRARSGAGKSPSIFHPTSDKGQHIIECSSTNILTECDIERGEEVIILKKEGKINMTQVHQSNYWRSIREDKVSN